MSKEKKRIYSTKEEQKAFFIHLMYSFQSGKQTETALILGFTQGQISQYVNAEREPDVPSNLQIKEKWGIDVQKSLLEKNVTITNRELIPPSVEKRLNEKYDLCYESKITLPKGSLSEDDMDYTGTISDTDTIVAADASRLFNRANKNANTERDFLGIQLTVTSIDKIEEGKIYQFITKTKSITAYVYYIENEPAFLLKAPGTESQKIAKDDIMLVLQPEKK